MTEIDINLIRLNLEMTPTKRLEAHQSALDLVQEIERSRRRVNAGKDVGEQNAPEIPDANSSVEFNFDT